jgi:hypothetical protein
LKEELSEIEMIKLRNKQDVQLLLDENKKLQKQVKEIDSEIDKKLEKKLGDQLEGFQIGLLNLLRNVNDGSSKSAVLEEYVKLSIQEYDRKKEKERPSS